jgi:hypothetical protein
MQTKPSCGRANTCDNPICYHKQEHNELASCEFYCEAEVCQYEKDLKRSKAIDHLKNKKKGE